MSKNTLIEELIVFDQDEEEWNDDIDDPRQLYSSDVEPEDNTAHPDQNYYSDDELGIDMDSDDDDSDYTSISSESTSED